MREIKNTMMNIFEITDLGLLCSYLGIEVHQGEFQIFLSKKPWETHILENFRIVDCNPTNTPIEA